MKNKNEIKIGLVGCGTVGSGVVEILQKHSQLLEQRVGVKLTLKKVASQHWKLAAKAGVSRSIYTENWREVVNDPEISIVVELIGGTGEAQTLVKEALAAGKDVVTANKALLAEKGAEIFRLAEKNQRDLCFEAAVGGGIPILRALREGFVANEIESIWAIINGTCNYILTQMAEKEEEFSQVLSRAQALGYAERDPRFDVEGIDAAHKLAILTSMAYGISLKPDAIYTEGISSLTPFDFQSAKRFGYAIKLLAIAKKTEAGIEARVHPTMIPIESLLANVREAFNAILLRGDFVGPSLLYGRGAGKEATASAVVADIVEIARNQLSGVRLPVPPLGHAENRSSKIVKMESLQSEYYLRFTVQDKPGVLAELTGALGKQGISICSVYQESQDSKRKVPVILFTHPAQESAIQKAIKVIEGKKITAEKTLLIRIEKDF